MCEGWGRPGLDRALPLGVLPEALLKRTAGEESRDPAPETGPKWRWGEWASGGGHLSAGGRVGWTGTDPATRTVGFSIRQRLFGNGTL